jgi:hypothetical protein
VIWISGNSDHRCDSEPPGFGRINKLSRVNCPMAGIPVERRGLLLKRWWVTDKLFRQSSDIVLIVHERTSRVTRIIRQPNRFRPRARQGGGLVLSLKSGIADDISGDERGEAVLGGSRHGREFNSSPSTNSWLQDGPRILDQRSTGLVILATG